MLCGLDLRKSKGSTLLCAKIDVTFLVPAECCRPTWERPMEQTEHRLFKKVASVKIGLEPEIEKIILGAEISYCILR